MNSQRPELPAGTGPASTPAELEHSGLEQPRPAPQESTSPASGPVGGYGLNQPPGVHPGYGSGSLGNPGAVSGAASTEPFAIASLTLAISSWLLGCCCPLIWVFTGTLAIIFSVVSIQRINANPQRYAGKGLAWAGLWLTLGAMMLYITSYVIGFGFSTGLPLGSP